MCREERCDAGRQEAGVRDGLAVMRHESFSKNLCIRCKGAHKILRSAKPVEHLLTTVCDCSSHLLSRSESDLKLRSL